tara:strand:+ start:713 stop:1000 length:288 start_codon:yes stop_codon:yes gene_type:complete
MVRLNIIKEIIGFSFKIIGFFWAIFDRFLCSKLTEKCIAKSCSNSGASTCYFLFLFIAIIFIICGYALITMKPREKKKVKKKIKKGFKLFGVKVS